MALHAKSTRVLFFLHYLKIDKNSEEIAHIIHISGPTLTETYSQPYGKASFEGIWVFCYIHFTR